MAANNNMSAKEIIAEIETLSLDERKAVLKVLSEGLEEETDTHLFDERSREEGGRPLREVIAEMKNAK